MALTELTTTCATPDWRHRTETAEIVWLDATGYEHEEVLSSVPAARDLMEAIIGMPVSGSSVLATGRNARTMKQHDATGRK